MSVENRIGVIGNVDSGKSTLTGVMLYGELDDGRGKAREKVFNHPHEKDKGKTSSISHNSMKIDKTSNRSLAFIDLAGHEKYLKTTLHGLSGYLIDYGMLLINGSEEGGVLKMTREHFSIILALNIPVMIVVTKIDMAQGDIIQQTLKKIQKMVTNMCRKRKMKRTIHMVNSEEDYFELTPEVIPLFKVSNKTGENIELLRKYLYGLKENKMVRDNSKYDKLFSIEGRFMVPNIGNVVCGKMLAGQINKNDKLFLGPIDGKWTQIVAKSFHDNFKNTVESLNMGETGTIAFAFSDKNYKNTFKKRKNNTKGLVIVSSKDDLDSLHTNYFEAMVRVLVNHSTTIKEKYQPIINCGKIVQAAQIVKIYDSNVLRAGDFARIRFKFLYKPEFLELDDTFLFREGKTKGIGKIVKIG
jgi:GTPase